MKFLDFAINTAKKAGALILKESKKTLKIAEKAKYDIVTNADKDSEKLIIKEIKKAFPSHAILAEEQAAKTVLKESFFSHKFIWIIDPLDGTLNFAHKIPIYSVSIALFETKNVKISKNFEYLEGEIIAGAVFAPVLNELFYAEKNKGAYLNGKKIKVSNTKKLANSLTVTGFPPVHKEINFPYLKVMMKKCQAVRRLGSAALDLCYVADGRFDGFWEFGLKPWDIAAGALIAAEADAKVTDTNGNLLDLFGADILATNGKIHKEMVETFRESLKNYVA